jgi:biotin synthase-related radical SAM superfamily protein
MNLVERCWVWRRGSDGEMGALLSPEGAETFRAEGDLFEVQEYVPAEQLRGAVETAEKATAMAERYVEAIERISEALPNVNRARLVIATLDRPRGQ